MFGTISVILSLTVYLIINFKEIQQDHKQRYVIYILVLISAALALTLPSTVSLGTTMKFMNGTIGEITKMVLAQ